MPTFRFGNQAIITDHQTLAARLTVDESDASDRLHHEDVGRQGIGIHYAVGLNRNAGSNLRGKSGAAIDDVMENKPEANESG